MLRWGSWADLFGPTVVSLTSGGSARQKIWYRKGEGAWFLTIRENGRQKQIRLLNAPNTKDTREQAEQLAIHELASRPKRAEHSGSIQSIQVCTEIVRRARSNLRTLHARLLELGYEFAEPDAALVDAGPDALAQIEQIEQR